MGMANDIWTIGSAVIDPISTGIGAAAEWIDPGGWFSAANNVGLNMFGKAGNAAAAGEDVGEALLTGAGTDVRRGINVFSGPVGWAAEGVATSADFMGHSDVGIIDSTTANYIGLGASAGAGAWNIGTSLLSGAETAASGVASTGADAVSPSVSSMLSDSKYLASFYGTNTPIFEGAGTGLTYAEAAERGTAAAYGLTGETTSGTGVFNSVLNAGEGAAKSSESLLDTIGAYASTGLKIGSAGLSLYNGYVGAQTAAEAAEAEAADAERRAEEETSKAEISTMQAEMNDLKQTAETNAAAEEKAQLAKRRRMLVGKGKTAAAANGVMLEARAESSPAMFEQDAAAEMAYEQGKIDQNMRIKNATHAMNAAMNRMEAATHRMSSSIYKGQADYARRVGNLRSTSSWIQGATGAAMGLASLFA